MSNLIFACIAPHGGLTLPEVFAGELAYKATKTRAAMEDLGRRMAKAAPETIVLITPHGHRVDGSFALLNNQRVRGVLEAEDNSGNTVTLAYEVDREFNRVLFTAGKVLGAPIVRMSYAVPDEPVFTQELDWGALIPLWFLASPLQPRPKVVIICADRGNMPWELFPKLGQAIQQAALQTGRKIALVASADMGHCHAKDGPYGYNPASAEFDAFVQQAIREQDLGRLLTIDQEWHKRAATDAYGTLLALHGAIAGTTMRGEFLSYEAPTYFGLMCAAYEPGTA
jgi:aromatic ring-opening dioxygenase LigB subunit